MKCPKCGAELRLLQDSEYPVGDDKQDVIFLCEGEAGENGHRFFVRLSQEDLLEDE